ncbi:NUDIX hydrolase [Caldichromatium japonicum]|uniref:NUDIX hydrolase n=2 Tax=Caldichromatium japonicum TaxID=2699430 RepID=A0A6G7VGF7_9GAMM|nr:NUDIX hydrolase [Caldichromatium japonicum]
MGYPDPPVESEPLQKSQVHGYTKRDGTYVKPYATNVVAKPKPAPGGGVKGHTAPPKPKPIPKAIHPKPNDVGEPVGLYEPHVETDAAHWGQPDKIATFIPRGLGGDCPYKLYGGNAVEGQKPDLKEPPLPEVAKGKHLSVGVVVEESDGRVWTISPSNRFGGYDNTFPKGTLEDGINPQASAIKEAFEKSGLKVEITGFLADVERGTSTTRYYRAKRVGGDPTDMGWESQAVHLVPRERLAAHLQSKYDQPLIAALTNNNEKS